jgi:hypothetical protein
MSVIIDDSDYRVVRNNDPSYQAMARIADTNNIFDVYQRYVKIGNSRNDFATQIANFSNNKGILNDGKPINMAKFFTNSSTYIDHGVRKAKNISIPYFKFKTNFALNFKDTSKIKETYDTKKIYEIGPEGTVVENEYSSYPLQRVDKLTINEMPSLFVYINGVKLPDDEIYIYTNKSFTDIFIPEKYIPGNIHDTKSNIDINIQIDYRQSGSECLYVKFNNESIIRESENQYKYIIDLNDLRYKYRRNNIKTILDKNSNGRGYYYPFLFFKNGLLNTQFINSVECVDNTLTIIFKNSLSTNILNDCEFYILNDMIYKYDNKNTDNILEQNGNKIAFYIPDDYFVDVLSGPITKNAISFFYDKKRVNDSKIIQTSRFSFEYISDDESFDAKKIEFIIEDINKLVDENNYVMYGDDYYLLNMLGVKRCVNKMLGNPSYSIFDDINYNIDFKEVLSNNGRLFNTDSTAKMYGYINDKLYTPSEKIKYLISRRPSLMRTFLERLKLNSKKIKVYGNANDVIMTSVYPIENESDEFFYKIYVNHILVETKDYSITRDNGYDIITISKNVLKPIGDRYGENEIELFQYDVSYKTTNIYKEQIPISQLELADNNESVNGFYKLIDLEGKAVYQKTYQISELPFNPEFVNDDICAIEQVQKRWYNSNNPEYYFFYPSSENIGYRMVKYFSIVNRTETTITINIQLHENNRDTTNGVFFLLGKEFNIGREIQFTNADRSYMEENDLMFPIYNRYVDRDINGNILNIYDYIPYITNSEPNIVVNGREKIYGTDYTFINPVRRDNVTTSYLIFKNQLPNNSIITAQFNSSKTNVLLVGYDDLIIDNKYGLVYLSELPYPVSPEYMNIYVNGEKLSSFDMDILSDKLVRFHHIYRPINSILITTNLKYKNSEIDDFVREYNPSNFERLLENIFHNCDPSKNIDANKPNIDNIYKINKYDSNIFINNDYENLSEENKSNYEQLIKQIVENRYKLSKDQEYDEFNNIVDPIYDDVQQYAKRFYDIYKSNQGFEIDVDSVMQEENPLENEEDTNYMTDTLEIMYLNWLANSGKTRTYGFKANNIDPKVLKYFSVYENVIIDNRIDIIVDSNRFYNGLKPDVTNDIYIKDKTTGLMKVQYPGVDYYKKRQVFYKLLKDVLTNHNLNTPYSDPETGKDILVQELCNHRIANILYPNDFPLKPDNDGIRWTGSNENIIHGITKKYKTYYIKFQIPEYDDNGEELSESINWYKEEISLGYEDTSLYNAMYDEFIANHDYKNISFITYNEYLNDNSLQTLNRS